MTCSVPSARPAVRRGRLNPEPTSKENAHIGRFISTALILVWSIAACGHSTSTSAPTTTPPAPAPPGVPPVVNTVTLSGRVTSVADGGIDHASLEVIDGPNQGRATTTDANGDFLLASLTRSDFTFSISAVGFTTLRRTVSLSQNATIDVALVPASSHGS